MFEEPERIEPTEQHAQRDRRLAAVIGHTALVINERLYRARFHL